MWYSQTTRKVYQLGGWWSSNNNENPAYIDDFPEPAIWEFDVDTERWAKSTDFEVSNNDQIVDRPGAAAFCDAPTLNRSYIFEGYTQRRSSPANSQYTPSMDFRCKFDTFDSIKWSLIIIVLEGMLELDTADKSQPKLTNISVPTYVGPRMNGAMVHVPVGEKGIIVNIGGQTTRDETELGVRIDDAASGNINVSPSPFNISIHPLTDPRSTNPSSTSTTSKQASGSDKRPSASRTCPPAAPTSAPSSSPPRTRHRGTST